MVAVQEINGRPAAEIKPGYFADLDGGIWSYWRTSGPTNNNLPVIRMDLPPRRLATKDNGGGYLHISALGYVHRLVWSAWVGDPGDLQVRHYDGCRAHNAFANLRIGTQTENEADKERHGTKVYGDAHFNAKLTVELVIAARQMWKSGLMIKQIIEQLNLGVCKSTLHEALVGKTWAHLDTVESPHKSGHWAFSKKPVKAGRRRQ